MPEVKCYFDESLGVMVHRYPVELGYEHVCQCKQEKTDTTRPKNGFATVGKREKKCQMEIKP